MDQIVFTPPDENDPGYLRRIRLVGRLQNRFKSGTYTEDDVDDLATLLLKYITEPQDREKAEELLWSASQKDLLAMMAALGGETAPDPLAGTSAG